MFHKPKVQDLAENVFKYQPIFQVALGHGTKYKPPSCH